MSRDRPAALAAIQERFYDLVTAPEGVARALADAGLSERDLGAMVVHDQRLGAVDRLDIYANMYFYRILDVLRDAYPKVTAVVGDAAFHNLVTEYLVACRPAHPSLAQAGDRLPRTLADHALVVERPWLPALAALERAYTELHDGPDAETLTLDDVRALEPERLAALPLRLIPCQRLLVHPFALDPLWQALEAGAAWTGPAAEPEALLVWRQDIAVYHRVLDEEERALLEAAARGATLPTLAEAIPAAAIHEAAQRVFHLLGRWLEDGLLVRPPL
jgi:hypothetical protein